MERGKIGDHKAFYELVTTRISINEGGNIMTLGERLRAEGRTEGRYEGKLEAATRLLARGADPAFVAEITGLPLKKIKSLQTETAH